MKSALAIGVLSLLSFTALAHQQGSVDVYGGYARGNSLPAYTPATGKSDGKFTLGVDVRAKVDPSYGMYAKYNYFQDEYKHYKTKDHHSGCPSGTTCNKPEVKEHNFGLGFTRELRLTGPVRLTLDVGLNLLSSKTDSRGDSSTMNFEFNRLAMGPSGGFHGIMFPFNTGESESGFFLYMSGEAQLLVGLDELRTRNNADSADAKEKLGTTVTVMYADGGLGYQEHTNNSLWGVKVGLNVKHNEGGNFGGADAEISSASWNWAHAKALEATGYWGAVVHAYYGW